MKVLGQLQPQPLWDYFEEICQVPRPSKKEEKIIKYMVGFARANHLQVKTDDSGNVLITKPAAKDREGVPVVVLQSHLDMVGEKNSDKVHDFEKDPIELIIEDGWVTANGTTLGADCGIGMAASMAVLTSTGIQHGPIECLFTVDEETGLSGAFALQQGFLNGDILLNLDSEDEGELFIGCAGGIDTVAAILYQKDSVPAGSIAVKLSVTGLLGGHSGDDIHKGRGNANKILNRFIHEASENYSIGLAEFNGGNLRNAIAREAFAIVVVPASEKGGLIDDFNKFAVKVAFEYEKTDPNLKLSFGEVELPGFIMDTKSRDKLLNALSACPHGVLEMSSRMEGMVETSSNLASVKFEGANEILITTSQRSEIESRKYMAAQMTASVFHLAGAKVSHSDGYPGWTPNTGSKILNIAIDSYKRLFGNEPVVRSIHAGLECGLFLEKYPGLDMVSFGPTILGAHSPDERINIESTKKFWKHLVDILENIS